MSREILSDRLIHADDCNGRWVSVVDGYDAVGVRYLHCLGCGASAHEPLEFKGAGHIGYLRNWPDLEHTPYSHESGLLDFPNFYSMDWTFFRRGEERQPVVTTPVPLAFMPTEAISNDEDAKENEGVSLRDVWVDPVARTIWLGHKQFMITSQYFRRNCLHEADGLRKHPDYLLRERVSFGLDAGWGSSWMDVIGAQLVPFLIHALDMEGLWPYFRLGGGKMLDWVYSPVPARKAA